MKTKISLIFASFLVVLTLLQCSKSDGLGSAPEVLWTNENLYNGKEFFNFSPVLYKDRIITGVAAARFANMATDPIPKIVALRKTDGQKLWEWQSPVAFTVPFNNYNYTYENIFILAFPRDVFAIDMETGKTLWHSKCNTGARSTYGFDNWVYRTEVVTGDSSTYGNIAKADVRTGQWQVVHKESINVARSAVGIIPINAGYDNYDKQKKFIYITTEAKFYNDPLNFGIAKFNTLTDSFIYRKPLSQNLTSGYFTNGKHIYLATKGIVHQFDYETGDYIKEIAIDKERQLETFIVHNNTLYVCGGDFGLHAYDVTTGRVLWSRQTISTNAANKLHYYKGVLYYTSGSDAKIHAVDAQTGEVIWAHHSAHRKGAGVGGYTSSFTIDEKENRIYVLSYFAAYCLKPAR
jgi:outer membrane protein assembly factor BamB